MKSLMEYIGLEPERYQVAWISGAEGIKFQETMSKLVKDVKQMGPNRKLRDAQRKKKLKKTRRIQTGNSRKVK